jgi:hypothetical protein
MILMKPLMILFLLQMILYFRIDFIFAANDFD